MKNLVRLFPLLIIFSLGSCSSEKCSQCDCNKIKEDSYNLINAFYIDNDSNKLEKSVLLCDKGIQCCDSMVNFFSLRKLCVLAELKDYDKALIFIESIDSIMFTQLPYYKSYLKTRFVAMRAQNKNDTITRDSCLKMIENQLDGFLQSKKNEVNEMTLKNEVSEILSDPLSTTITQYYYVKSILYGNKSVEDELNELCKAGRFNSRFAEHILIYCKTSLLEFIGI